MDNSQASSTLFSIIRTVSSHQSKLEKQVNAVALDPEDEIINLGDNFDFDGFQVVRREFFAHTHEPSATLNDFKFYVNSACLKRFPETTCVQALVNQETKILALMPCPESAKDSFFWCAVTKGKRKPKQITCKLFFAKVMDLMGWNPQYKYKILGKLIQANGDTLIAFDLSAAEIYQRSISKGTKPKLSRTPVFPAEWQNQFGLPYNEHRKSTHIDVFDGYAIYSIKDTAEETVSSVTASEETNTLEQNHSKEI